MNLSKHRVIDLTTTRHAKSRKSTGPTKNQNISMEGSSLESIEMGEQPKEQGITPVKQNSNTFQQLKKTCRGKGLNLESLKQTDQQKLQDWRDCQPVTGAF